MDHVDWYISHHPWFYGLTKNIGLGDYQNGLAKKAYDMALEKQKERVEPNIIPHPLYVELQMRSPMGMLRDYNLPVSDME